MTSMVWVVLIHGQFDSEVDALPNDVRKALASSMGLLEIYGPRLARPHADTLAGSRHANMKELRFTAADGAWRAAFAFDPKREAILLVAADKSGVAQRRFYARLIAKADQRFDDHLAQLAAVKE